MLIIAHRGNTRGPSPDENNPAIIEGLLQQGMHVEVDVHYVYGSFYLGHNAPVYEVPQNWLLNDKLWCHAKHHDALQRLLEIDAHCFGHDGDDFVMTSRGYIWCHPRMATKTHSGLLERSVLVMPANYDNAHSFYGVCADYTDIK